MTFLAGEWASGLFVLVWVFTRSRISELGSLASKLKTPSSSQRVSLRGSAVAFIALPNEWLVVLLGRASADIFMFEVLLSQSCTAAVHVATSLPQRPMHREYR